MAVKRGLSQKGAVKMEDRRQYKRIECHIPCHFRIFVPGMEELQMRGLIRNISGGGVFLEVPFDDTSIVKVRGEVNLEFTMELNDENMFVRSLGNIARLARNGLGIEFTDLPEEIRDRVVDYVGE